MKKTTKQTISKKNITAKENCDNCKNQDCICKDMHYDNRIRVRCEEWK